MEFWKKQRRQSLSDQQPKSDHEDLQGYKKYRFLGFLESDDVSMLPDQQSPISEEMAVQPTDRFGDTKRYIMAQKTPKESYEVQILLFIVCCTRSEGQRWTGRVRLRTGWVRGGAFIFPRTDREYWWHNVHCREENWSWALKWARWYHSLNVALSSSHDVNSPRRHPLSFSYNQSHRALV